MNQSADIVVIGGGCNGASIAYHLARRQAGRVVLVEKDGIAAGATGRSSALVRQHYTHETLARMAFRALGIFEQFGEQIGGEAGFRCTGALVLIGEHDLAAAEANVAMQQRVGIETRLITPAGVADLEPRLALDGVGAAAWEPRSGYADPVGTAAGFAEAARRLGAELRLGVTVQSIVAGPGGVERVETSAGPIATRQVIVVAGYRSRELLLPHGLDLPIRPIRHSIAILERSAGFGRPHPVILDYSLGGYYRPEGATMTMVGSSVSDEGYEDHDVENDPSPDERETTISLGRFYRRFPSEGEAGVRRGYTGVYDSTPDTQPAIGPVAGVDGLYVAAGFSGHGFKLSPVTGELVAECVLDGRSSLIDLSLFDPARFAAGRLITVPHPYTRQTLG